LDIDGGTVLFFEKNCQRYLITAQHVWEGIIALSEKNAGRRQGAFVYAGKFLPLKKDEVTVKDDRLDVIVMKPDWLSAGIDGYDFYSGDTATVSAGDAVTTWGYPGAKRTRLSDKVACRMEQISGEATAPFENCFKFANSPTYDLGGFSGAPVFRADNKLVGLVSEASSALGIVVCHTLLSVIDQL